MRTCLILYSLFNPSDYKYFPKCPLKATTCIDCPGCGSQRAIHNLLNLNFADAFRENALLILSIPYLMVGAYLDLKKNKTPQEVKWRERLMGTKAIWIIFGIIIIFWILRNIPSFSEYL